MSSKMKENIEIIPSSGNIFADLELTNPEEHLAKVKLVIQINKIIENKGLTQKNAAKILGIDQPKISALSCGRVRGFSIERLIGFLNKLDQDVEIVVKEKPEKRKSPACLTATTQF